MNASRPLPAPAGAPMNVWLERLCACDTTTGQEDAGLAVLTRLLDDLGAGVWRQPVAEERTNVLATWGEPRVLLATHLDTVPPFVAPTVTDVAVRGRGACDAKGQIVAQLGAIARLLGQELRDVAWLGVVGEETDSIGARRATELGSRLGSCEAVIVGEPTACRLATGQRGSLHLRLRTIGHAVHSGTPEAGRNAVFELIDWLTAARALEPGRDPRLGVESWNLGTIRGGGALNVVPDAASCDILARTVPASTFEDRLAELAPAGATVEVVHATPPAHFETPDGFEASVVPFGSDAPYLRALAAGEKVVLAGPGRIATAHTDAEEITHAELADGVELNVRLARHFLDGGA